jgi:hypothetical protein
MNAGELLGSAGGGVCVDVGTGVGASTGAGAAAAMMLSGSVWVWPLGSTGVCPIALADAKVVVAARHSCALSPTMVRAELCTLLSTPF